MTDNKVMARPHYLILIGGGLRSLVAAALLLKRPENARLTPLFVDDGRTNAAGRQKFAAAQAEHLGLGKLHQMQLPQLFGMDLGRGPAGEPIGPLATPQLLLAALAYARANQAERVIYPASCNGQVDAVARATEQITLCEHLAEAEGVAMPALEAPLLELTDQQVLELGSRLQTPWKLAWSCLASGSRPCGACAGCRRRREAFEKANLVDQTG